MDMYCDFCNKKIIRRFITKAKHNFCSLNCSYEYKRFSSLKDSLKILLPLKNTNFIIWFTGFWEGEGCINLYYRNRKRPIINFTISQSEKEIITKIHTIFQKGSISIKKSPLSKKNCYSYFIGKCSFISGLIYLMTPYLKTIKRKTQIKKVIKECNLQPLINRFKNA